MEGIRTGWFILTNPDFGRSSWQIIFRNLVQRYPSIIIKSLSRFKIFDPKSLVLPEGSMNLGSVTNEKKPQKLIAYIAMGVASKVLWDKLWNRSPKPLSQLFGNATILTTLSYFPAISVKLALYVFRKDSYINMDDRKERTLYIIYSIGLTALLTPYILKISRRTCSFSTTLLMKYSLKQIVIYSVVAEIFAWNDKKVAEKFQNFPRKDFHNIISYREVGPATRRVIDAKAAEALTCINAALKNPLQWEAPMSYTNEIFDLFIFLENLENLSRSFLLKSKKNGLIVSFHLFVRMVG